MLPFFFGLLVINPLVVAAPHKHRCSSRPATTIVEWVTVTAPVVGPTSFATSTIDSAPSSNPAPALTTESSSAPVVSVTPTPESTEAVETVSEEPTSTVAPSLTSVLDNTFADATPIAYKIGATSQCGNSDRLIMPGKPWTVSNAMYGAKDMVGSQCTNFDRLLESTNGTELVQWTSITNVEYVEDTKDICKGYSNIGVGVNLKQPLSEIKSIPAFFKWSRTVQSDFRGANIFDFITAPTSGDGTSTATSEFMLFLQIWGGQVPIGWAQGPVATLEMYGTSWKLYEGVNPGSGVTVRSMLPDVEYEGEFSGDLKEWLDAMASRGYINISDYVNVGNSGTEIFYGKTTQEVTTALEIVV
ncbi:glycoside hydrolase family 12 protein [Xylariaceae sp. FL1651]|nr:glycoside hydrolase family 12 protein [Xylariaceae sp. FL1651]